MIIELILETKQVGYDRKDASGVSTAIKYTDEIPKKIASEEKSGGL